MAHPSQLQFVKQVAEYLEPRGYAKRRILEIGSYDINGSIRRFFPGSKYVGVDLGEGPGVDVVCEGSSVQDPDGTYDLTISCESFEHNPKWLETFLNMHRVTKNGGVLVFTCATKGRLEHGTTRTSPNSSPGTQSVGWDYYQNLTEDDFRKRASLEDLFESFFFLTNRRFRDLCFVGQKRGAAPIFRFDAADLKLACRQATKEIQPERRYPRIVQGIAAATLLPLRIAMCLPDKQFQNVAFHYTKIDRAIKGPLRRAVEVLFKPVPPRT